MTNDPLLRLEAVTKQFAGGAFGLKEVDLEILPGEFISLLGPSGCGKTTSLRVIAGFDSPTSGRVLLDGKDITGLRPYDRPVNTVFQDYALFPHMDVSENVGFGLSLRRITGADRARRAARALDMVGLADRLKARVQDLSGGQRQRVALARAIVCEPRVLLLDEPLSALDAHLREQMQVELKRLQSTLGTTFVMVTHDQTEAMSISDRIVVMNKAEIEQIASPAELYDRPATRFVASFIGTMNLMKARFEGAEDGKLRFSAGAISLLLDPGSATPPDKGAACMIGIRPEDFLAAPAAGASSTAASVKSVVFHGRSLRLHADLGSGQSVVVDVARRPEETLPAVGDVTQLALRPGAAWSLLPA